MSTNAGRPGEKGDRDVARPPAPRTGPDDDASAAAARLLEMTARETDRWRAEATSEAAGLLVDAREEADRLVQEARVEAYRVREETSARRKRSEDEIARLEQVETEHREQLRRHLTAMLERLDASPDES